METRIQERRHAPLRNPILISGFPGLGSVGKITLTYLRQQLNAKPLADLYSPYFPHHVVVDSRGRVRLPCARFYRWQTPQKGAHDLILVTADTPAQGLEGQYVVTDAVLNYAGHQGAKTVITMGGFRGPRGSAEPKVVSLSSSRTLLTRMLTAGAEPSPAGTPVTGFTGLALGLARFRRMKAACVLGETVGYMPDPKAAKAVVRVLQRFLGISLDLSPLDEAIRRTGDIFGRLGDVQREMEALATERAEIEGRQITYIS